MPPKKRNPMSVNPKNNNPGPEVVQLRVHNIAVQDATKEKKSDVREPQEQESWSCCWWPRSEMYLLSTSGETDRVSTIHPDFGIPILTITCIHNSLDTRGAGGDTRRADGLFQAIWLAARCRDNRKSARGKPRN